MLGFLSFKNDRMSCIISMWVKKREVGGGGGVSKVTKLVALYQLEVQYYFYINFLKEQYRDMIFCLSHPLYRMLGKFLEKF